VSTPPLPTINGIEAYKLSISWQLGEPEDISYSVYGPDAVRMNAGQLPPQYGLLPISLGDGRIDARMLSNGPQMVYDQPGYVSETGKSIGYALQTSAPIHRFSVQQVTLADCFNGAANALRVVPSNDPTDGEAVQTIAGGTLPDQYGIARTPVGVNAGQNAALSFTYVLDAVVQQIPLDVDIWEDNLLHATQTITERLGSYVDAQRTQFYVDSGDTGPDGQQCVVLGRQGASSIIFDGETVPILRMTTAQAQTTDMCASCSFVGGDSQHGFPGSGTIKDLQYAASAGVSLAAFYTQIDVGGVYFWRGDGAFYPCSQAMGVNGLAIDDGAGMVYAATDVGVYSKASADVLFSQANFTRMGTMVLKCTKLQVDSGNVYALATLAGSSEQHVLLYDGVTNNNLGMNGWHAVCSIGGIVDFAVFGGLVFVALHDLPGTIYWQSLSDATTQGRIVIGTGAVVVGLDAIVLDGVTLALFVRTDQGSLQLFVVQIRVGQPYLVAANGDLSLEDPYWAPVQVNRVVGNYGTTLRCSSGEKPALYLAATAIGVFATGDPAGASGWYRTDGQSSIGDFDCTFIGVATPTTYGSAVYQEVLAASDSAIYLSRNGTVNWIDVLSEPLDAGPYFWQYFWAQRRLPAMTDLSIPVSYGGGSYVLQRTLTGVGQWAFVLVNPNSQAPAGQYRSAEISELSTPAMMSDVTASQILVEAMARFLAYTGRPQVVVEVTSVLFDLDSPLRSLRPCMAASVTGTAADYTILPGGAPYVLGQIQGDFYVLSHQITYDRDSDPNAITTTTRLGSLLLNDRTDPLTVTADLWYAMSRNQRYSASKGK
jgi:hypothetical protein